MLELQGLVEAQERKVSEAKQRAMAYVQELLAEKRGLQSKRAEAEAAGQVALEAQREEGKVRCAAARQEHAAASEARATAEAEARQASELLERLQGATATLRVELAPRRTAGEGAAVGDEARREQELAERLEEEAAEAEAAAATQAAAREAALASLHEAEAEGARLRAEALRWRREAEASEAAATTRAYELETLREAHVALASATLVPPLPSPPPPSARGAGVGAGAEAGGAGADGVGAARAARGAGGAAESEAPLVEYLAESLIACASHDSVITNPILGWSAMIDYVSDWQAALGYGEDAARGRA